MLLRSLCLSLLLAAAVAGCAPAGRGIADPERYPQRASAYLPEVTAASRLVSPETQAALDADFDRRFFAPWEREGANLTPGEAFGAGEALRRKRGFAENLLPFPEERWRQLEAAQRRQGYPSLAYPAVTVRNTDCRVMPTARPFLLDPELPGEGFPFDYFQRSALWAGTPLLVTHASVDGAWLFAEAGAVAGWLPAGDVARAGEDFREAYRSGRYAALLRDGVTLADGSGRFLAQAGIGALFPVTADTPGEMEILVPGRDSEGAALLRTVRLPPGQAVLKPLRLQADQIALVADRMLGQLYGWGGLFGNRDCSAALRDLFTPFGLWLPRHSAAQARQVGTFHDLAGLDPDGKRAYLLAHGVPFYSLVWLDGHIGLYLGPRPGSGEPMLLHDLWGVRTGGWFREEGRALVGRMAITSFHPGEERPDVARNRFYGRILGLTVLPGVGGTQNGDPPSTSAAK